MKDGRIMKQQYDLIMYISVLEDSIAPQMKMFENSVRARWHSLPNLEANTIYHICPYFGHINSDIENFFETGLMRIAHNISRQYTSFSEKELELSWFGINSNYSDLLDQYCTPFVEAFESASSGGLNRLNQARVDMERTSSDRRHGYITNSFTYMLAAETVNTIASAMRAVENDRQAWQVATAPQQAMHNKLTSLWSKNFEPVFMKQIEAEDVLVAKEIIEHLCLASNFTYETYENAKNDPVFSSEKAQFIAKLSAEKQNSESEKKNEREQIISQLNAEISAIDEKLAGLGFSLWGDKRKERKILEQKKEQLSAEARATTNYIPLPSTYVFALSHGSAPYRKFANMVFGSDFFTKDWKFIYNATEKGYIAYTPDGEALFVLKGDFLRTYGHGRTFGARWETFLDEAANATVTRIRFALFEIDK